MPERELNVIIRGFIRERFMVGIPDESIRDTDSLLEKGIMDSTGVLELVGFIEEKFGVAVEDEELVPDNLGSMVNILRYVQSKMSEKV